MAACKVLMFSRCTASCLAPSASWGMPKPAMGFKGRVGWCSGPQGRAAGEGRFGGRGVRLQGQDQFQRVPRAAGRPAQPPGAPPASAVACVVLLSAHVFLPSTGRASLLRPALACSGNIIQRSGPVCTCPGSLRMPTHINYFCSKQDMLCRHTGSERTLP